MNAWNEEPVVFECEGDRLVGILHRTAHPEPQLGVLIVVGGPQYRVGSHRQFVLMARDIAAAGFPVMRFDYRGMGDSEGSHRDFHSVTRDLLRAVRAFDAATGGQLRDVAMFGLCDAASAILMNLPALERVTAVAIANPWVHSEVAGARSYVKHYYGRRLLQRAFWSKLARGEVRLFHSALGFLSAFLRSRTNSDAPSGFVGRMLSGLQRFTGPILVISSGRDLTAREFDDVCERDAAWRAAVARPQVSRIRFPQADHTFSRAADLVNAADEMIVWLTSVAERPACR